ncbi:hypothetical protein K461DRAFT_297810 [Myriangium duriaei CBS 260.36]|uniref:DNA/RNA-binding domain-containing protein n=1 Tax=Myriangium duriaei CBS 260.36 TaxID=1168546 RepID=A0A9P4IQV1_9PEZI|nr:hypothetical protein K461DRAFT_297810 [Myriangium duriaei CBS 260.36]
MPDEVEKLVRDVKDAEGSFGRLIGSEKDLISGLPNLYTALNRFRASVELLAQLDIAHTRKSLAETRLWNAHTQLHTRFRKSFKELRATSPARPVETRKFIKTYLEFLKDGQRWYRTFIANLNQRYGAIPELKQIAGHIVSVSESPSHTNHRDHCLMSCYQALISLGDLARWRATEKLDKEPTWGPAIGYYDLAVALRSSSGVAFNQRSIIAQHDRDHLRATYYVYRSIVVEEPFEKGLDNLGIHMSSLRKKWGSSDFSPKSNIPGFEGANKALTVWFLRLHSMCYLGEMFKGHDELEAEVINRLESHVLQAENPGLLMKIILINMAAERTTLIRLTDADITSQIPILQAFYFYQRLNVKTFNLLMTIWTKLLGSGVISGILSSDDHGPKQAAHLISTILPALRTYCRWLAASSRFLLPESIDANLKDMGNELWSNYAVMLSVTIASHPIRDLPQVIYQLEEDADVSGFQPLDTQETEFVWHCDDGQPKLKHNDAQVRRNSANAETMARIRDIQIIGLHLAAQEETPIAFENNHFTCRGVDLTHVQIPNGGHQAPTKIDSASTKVVTPPFEPLELRRVRQASAISPHAKVAPRLGSPPQITEGTSRAPIQLDPQEELAKSMVDDLVGPDESPHPMKRSGSVLENYSEDVSAIRLDGSPSSFVPTPPTSRSISKVERLHQNSLFGNGDRPGYTSSMHSPLLFGNGGVWSTAPQRSKSSANETPPNGQGG